MLELIRYLQDSLKIVKKDSNKPFLELMKAEDSSVVTQKKKIIKNKVTQAAPVVAITTNDSLIQDSTIVDTTTFTLGNTAAIPIRKAESIKKNKTVTEQNIDFEPTVKTKVDSFWPSLVLTVALLLLAITKAFGSKRFAQIYKSIFSNYSAHEVVREEKVFFHRVNFSLFFVYVFTISLFLYFVTTHLNPGLLSPSLYPLLLLGVFIAYTIKFSFNSILAFLFSYSNMVPSYSFNVLLYNYVLGIVLIPALALVYFSDFQSWIILKYVIIPIILITLLIRFIRFFAIGISNNVSFLYIILYICTLEILPLVVLGKFFIP